MGRDLAGGGCTKADEGEWSAARGGELLQRLTDVHEVTRAADSGNRHRVPASQALGCVASARDDIQEHSTDTTAATRPNGSRLLVSCEIDVRLSEYQREGIAWMWRLYLAKHGGILADELGLGKTVQACSFLSCARNAGARHALVVVPVTLIAQWSQDATRWCPDWPVYCYHGTSLQRACALRNVMQSQGGVLLTSYSVFKSSAQELLCVKCSDGCADGRFDTKLDAAHAELDHEAQRKPWDIIICDEAHVMRNISTLSGKSLPSIRANCRILLTGTLVALQDLWALMEFAQPGLLGNHVTCLTRFRDPIDRGSERGASASSLAVQKCLCEQLWQVVEPHLLCRTKEIAGLIGKPEGDGRALAPQTVLVGSAEPAALPPKVETVVWLLPTQEQMEAYRQVLGKSDVIREATSKATLGTEVFRAIGLLKKLCNHPSLALQGLQDGAWMDFLSDVAGLEGIGDQGGVGLLRKKAARGSKAGRKRPLASGRAAVGEDAAHADASGDAARSGQAVEALLAKLPRDMDAVVAQSAKLRCLAALLPALAAKGHRTLIFSQGTKMMDLVELCVLRPRGLSYLRIDGQTDIQSRAEKVRQFQAVREGYQCMLLTTSAGSYELNFTRADRVVLLVPDWNPSVDLQAIELAYRIGQTREVRIYRLVMSGLVEDNIFRLQMFKMGLSKTTLEGTRHQSCFTSAEIRGLFELADPSSGETRKTLIDKHGQQQGDIVKHYADLDGAHDGWLQAGPVVGLSNFTTLCGSFVGQREADAGSAEVSELRIERAQVECDGLVSPDPDCSAKERLNLASEVVEASVGEVTETVKVCARRTHILKQRQAEPAAAKHMECAAKEELDKVPQVQADVFQIQSEKTYPQAVEAAEAAKRDVASAAEASAAADEEVKNALEEIKKVFGCVGRDDSTVGSVSSTLFAATMKSARKTCDRAATALECARVARSKLAKAEDVIVQADAHLAETGCGAYNSAIDASSLKASQPARKGAERHLEKVEAAMLRAREGAKSASVVASAAMAVLQDAGRMTQELLLANALQTTPAQVGVSGQVKSALQAVKATLRQLGERWLAATAAHDARSKAAALHRRAAQESAFSASSMREHAAKQAGVDSSPGQMGQEHKRTLCYSSDREAVVEAARGAFIAPEVQKAGAKRRRVELRKGLGEARQQLKPARAVTTPAIVGHPTLPEMCAKRGSVALELTSASNASASAASAYRASASTHAALSAAPALRDDACDVKQVEETYKVKKKPRVIE